MMEENREEKVLEVEGRRLVFRRPFVPQRDLMARDLCDASDVRRQAIYRSVPAALAEDKNALAEVLDRPNGKSLAAGIINEISDWFGETEIGPDYERDYGVLVRGKSLGFRPPTDEEALKAAQDFQVGSKLNASRAICLTCALDPAAVEALVSEAGPLTYLTIATGLLFDREPEVLNIRVVTPD
jgi:hypothetical protein